MFLPDIMKEKASPSKKNRLFPVAVLLVAAGAITYLFRKGKLQDFLKNQYLLAAGMMGSLAAIIFFLFRFIRFLVRLYP
jgi:hypothetical protein